MIKVKKWTGNEIVKVKDIIKVLNEALKIDGNAINELFSKRVEVNNKLANHKSIQVRQQKEEKTCTLSILGLLNGIIGIDKNVYGPITAYYSETGTDDSEESIRDKITKFQLTKTFDKKLK